MLEEEKEVSTYSWAAFTAALFVVMQFLCVVWVAGFPPGFPPGPGMSDLLDFRFDVELLGLLAVFHILPGLASMVLCVVAMIKREEKMYWGLAGAVSVLVIWVVIAALWVWLVR